MELISSQHEEQLFMQFQTDWLGKWVPTIVKYAQKRNKDLSDALEGRFMYILNLLNTVSDIVQGFTCTLWAKMAV